MQRGLLFILLFLFTVPISAQETISSESWRWIVTEDMRYAVPNDWITQPNRTSVHLQPLAEGGIIAVYGKNETDMTLEAIASGEETRLSNTDYITVLDSRPITLPSANAHRIEYIADESTVYSHQVYYLILADGHFIHFRGFTNGILDDALLQTFITIFDRAANTLQVIEPDDASWILHSDEIEQAFIRIPPSWTKSDVSNVLTVREVFGDAVVSVQHQMIDGITSLATVRNQLLRIYTEQGYTITSFEEVQLPVGNALLFRLTTTVERQYQYVVVISETRMLFITATTPIDQFADYEPLLRQMVDTVELRTN